MSYPTTTHYRDPDRGFRIWNRDEIVTETGNGQWVPNPQDLIFDPAQGFFLVTEVDYSTGLSVLTPWSLPKEPEDNPDEDVLVGSGPGYSSESYRVFIDQTVTPHILAPDSRLRFYGSKVQYYKVFLGSDISDEYGKVISAFFDPSGNFLGSSIPVETVEVTNADGSINAQDTIKAPMVGYTSENLTNGERVTLVAYSADGGVVSVAQLLAVNTGAIRQVDGAKKYVKSIQIESPFISSADPQTIEFPINVTVESLPMTAVVHYSDGSRLRLPIDGSKFSLYGLRNYVATIVGQQFPMVLAYNLAEDEVSYTLEPTANRRLTVSYAAKTAAADGAYEVKLYIYPVWVSPSAGYRLEYWLYNLDRQTFYNATPHVELGATSAPFQPTQYGTTQTVTVALDLNKVDGKFAPYRHVQTFQVALLSAGTQTDVDSWIVYFRPDQAEGFGRDAKAVMEFVNTNFWRLTIHQGHPSKEVWLQNLYQKIEPLTNPQVEAAPPVPTHFRVALLNNKYEFSVEQWDEELVVNNDLKDGELVYIEWISRNYDGDLQLGMTALPVRQLLE